MFSPVHVILPFSDAPLAEAIRASLAPYRRGVKGATWEKVVTAAHGRFADHWAVCVACHL